MERGAYQSVEIRTDVLDEADGARAVALPDVEENLPPWPGDALCGLLEGLQEACVVVRRGSGLEDLV